MTTMTSTAKVAIQDDEENKISSADKEKQPIGTSEKELMAEIKTTAEKLDAEALERIQGDISEARRAMPEPQLPPDVEDSGVTGPVQEAEKVVTKGGSTLELPVTEEAFREGQKTPFRAKVVNGVVTGVSGIIPLTMWIGRIIKMVHKHTTGRVMKVVFKRSSDDRVSGLEGGKDAD